MNINQNIIKYLLKNPAESERDILSAKRKFCKLYDIAGAPTNAELLAEYNKQKINNPALHQLLRKRRVRTLSGIAPIAVLTKPYPCPGKCAYCPNEKAMPKSYLANEPAVMRAILCKFDPYKQVQLRLRALANNGHETDKLELIVMGGTWSYLPESYQIWYLKECFRAANDSPKNIKRRDAIYRVSKDKRDAINGISTQLKKEQKRNEAAQNRIIGLTLETRPDFIDEKELWKMRQYGCTRIEIGVQHLDNRILKLNQRGHDVATTINATKLMRQFGFKITYHMMLNLPGSTPAKDFKMMRDIFENPNYRPDQIKIYPTVVSKNSLLYRWYKQGKWKSYTTKQLVNLLIKIKSITPPWVRILRVIRDIPKESIIAGNKITNMRQIIKSEMEKKKIECQCTRCREVGRQEQFPISNFQFPKKLQITNYKIAKRKYRVSKGTEYFLSFESPDKKILYAFCRLFLPKLTMKQCNNKTIPPYNTALIRELHTYGQLAPIGQIGNIQHLGLGKKLLAQAESIAQKQNYDKLSIISGIGVRNYYRQLGYRLENTYMVKKI